MVDFKYPMELKHGEVLVHNMVQMGPIVDEVTQGPTRLEDKVWVLTKMGYNIYLDPALKVMIRKKEKE